MSDERTRDKQSDLSEALSGLLSRPSPKGVWDLRAAMLAADVPAGDALWEILQALHRFLVQLASKSNAREYSHFASMLDLGAIAGVALQNVLESGQSRNWWQRVVLGFMSEGLMVVAARQYVRAWEEEMQATYDDAAWALYGFYWRLSEVTQPELAPDGRRQLVERLLGPIRDEQASGMIKASALVFLFQMLIVSGAWLGGWLAEDTVGGRTAAGSGLP